MKLKVKLKWAGGGNGNLFPATLFTLPLLHTAALSFMAGTASGFGALLWPGVGGDAARMQQLQSKRS